MLTTVVIADDLSLFTNGLAAKIEYLRHEISKIRYLHFHYLKEIST